MGIDIRTGRGDHFTRYKLYRHCDINDKVALSNSYVGIVHAKDITSYDDDKTQIGRIQTNVVRAVIETFDKIDVHNNDYLYCLAEQQWYIVDRVTQNSWNESQQFSSRPKITTTINIRRGV